MTSPDSTANFGNRLDLITYSSRRIFIDKNEIKVESLPPRSCLSISSIVPTLKMKNFFENSFSKMGKAIPNMPEDTIYFAHYRNVDWVGANKGGLFAFLNMMLFIKWDVSACISVQEEIEPGNEVEYRELPRMERTIQTIHLGPYHKVAGTYKRISEYAAQENLPLTNQSFEIYLNDPREVPKSDIQTLVIVPIADEG